MKIPYSRQDINTEDIKGPILYFPIDLDSDITFTINFDIFYQEIELLKK